MNTPHFAQAITVRPLEVTEVVPPTRQESGDERTHPPHGKLAARKDNLANSSRGVQRLVLATVLGTMLMAGAADANVFGGITGLANTVKGGATSAIPIIAGAIAAVALLMYLFGNSKSKELFLKVAIIAGSAGAIIGLVGG